jgi:uncharacterized protein YecT (DUF1311 family)
MKKHIVILLLLLSAVAHAQDNSSAVSSFSKTYEACIKKAGTPGFYDQSASAKCDEEEIKFQKNRINLAYKKLLKLWADNPNAVAELNKAQKTWVQSRDETYNLLSNYGGDNGQVVYVVSSQYQLQALADQASLLEELVASNGGD